MKVKWLPIASDLTTDLRPGSLHLVNSFRVEGPPRNQSQGGRTVPSYSSELIMHEITTNDHIPCKWISCQGSNKLLSSCQWRLSLLQGVCRCIRESSCEPGQRQHNSSSRIWGKDPSQKLLTGKKYKRQGHFLYCKGYVDASGRVLANQGNNSTTEAAAAAARERPFTKMTHWQIIQKGRVKGKVHQKYRFTVKHHQHQKTNTAIEFVCAMVTCCE